MRTRRPVPARSIGLALGGGGARGLAHILVLEVLDAMGVRPARIAGTSIGAIYGAAYASGLSAAHIRAHTEEVLSQRYELARRLFAARAEPVSHLLNLLPIRTALLSAESLMDLLLPSRVAHDFSALTLPLEVVATDFYAQEPKVIGTGPLRPAIAASMALPAIFSPVVIDGRPLVDGGLVNPLPFDLLTGTVDLTIAVDVAGARRRDDIATQPSATEVLMAASQIFQHTIVQEKLRLTQPDIYLPCPVGDFTVLDFHRFREVLAAAAPVKEQLKRQLDLLLRSTDVDFETRPRLRPPPPQTLLPTPPTPPETVPGSPGPKRKPRRRLARSGPLP
jgi:NTE family protein